MDPAGPAFLSAYPNFLGSIAGAAMTLALFAALFSTDAEAARVVVKPVPVVVATPHVRVAVGAPVLVAQPRPVVVAQPRPKPCASFRHLPPHKRPKRCR